MTQRTSISHLAIIMDGNGRWAETRGLPRWKGHQAGAKAVRRTVEWVCREGIPALTLFAFSSENWKRPAHETDTLFRLFRKYLADEQPELIRNGIRLSAIGRRDRLTPAVRKALEETEAATRDGLRLHLRLAIDYGARHEIAEAARWLGWRIAEGELHPEQIDEIRLDGLLSNSSIPDPDLIIRTSGEYRLSNFLLWQAAYSELHFCPRLWPDFGPADLEAAIADYEQRSRRFGGIATGSLTAGVRHTAPQR